MTEQPVGERVARLEAEVEGVQGYLESVAKEVRSVRTCLVEHTRQEARDRIRFLGAVIFAGAASLGSIVAVLMQQHP